MTNKTLAIILASSENDKHVVRFRQLFSNHFHDVYVCIQVKENLRHALNSAFEQYPKVDTFLVIRSNTHTYTHLTAPQFVDIIKRLNEVNDKWERFDLDGLVKNASAEPITTLQPMQQPVLICSMNGVLGHIFTKTGAEFYIRNNKNKNVYCTIPVIVDSQDISEDTAESSEYGIILMFLIIIALVVAVIWGLFQLRK